AAGARNDDLILVGFFGQGAPLGEKSCFFATDSTFKNRTKDAVAAGDIEQAFAKLTTQRGCAFVAVNCKGFDSGKDPAPDANVFGCERSFLGTFKKADEDAKDLGANRVVFMPNSGLRASLDLANHGLFAKVITDGLQGKADKEGYEPDGLV